MLSGATSSKRISAPFLVVALALAACGRGVTTTAQEDGETVARFGGVVTVEGDRLWVAGGVRRTTAGSWTPVGDVAKAAVDGSVERIAVLPLPPDRFFDASGITTVDGTSYVVGTLCQLPQEDNEPGCGNNAAPVVYAINAQGAVKEVALPELVPPGPTVFAGLPSLTLVGTDEGEVVLAATVARKSEAFITETVRLLAMETTSDRIRELPVPPGVLNSASFCNSRGEVYAVAANITPGTQRKRQPFSRCKGSSSTVELGAWPRR